MSGVGVAGGLAGEAVGEQDVTERLRVAEPLGDVQRFTQELQRPVRIGERHVLRQGGQRPSRSALGSRPSAASASSTMATNSGSAPGAGTPP